jgi:molybdate transport system substrate-binding protein
MVSTGNAKVGIVSLSQILEKDIEDFFLVPDEFHDPIFQDVVLLKNSERKKLAKRLMDYLRSEKAKNIIKQFGYTIK